MDTEPEFPWEDLPPHRQWEVAKREVIALRIKVAFLTQEVRKLTDERDQRQAELDRIYRIVHGR